MSTCTESMVKMIRQLPDLFYPFFKEPANKNAFNRLAHALNKTSESLNLDLATYFVYNIDHIEEVPLSKDKGTRKWEILL